MTPVKLQNCEIVLVDVPEGANGFAYAPSGRYGKNGPAYDPLIGFNHPDPEINWEEISLPPGSYELLGRFSEITEEVAAGILADYGRVHEDQIFYPEFKKWNFVTALYFETAKESLLSLILSHGHTKDCLIIKKVK